jgi:hypothetical protein
MREFNRGKSSPKMWDICEIVKKLPTVNQIVDPISKKSPNLVTLIMVHIMQRCQSFKPDWTTGPLQLIGCIPNE